METLNAITRSEDSEIRIRVDFEDGLSSKADVDYLVRRLAGRVNFTHVCGRNIHFDGKSTLDGTTVTFEYDSSAVFTAYQQFHAMLNQCIEIIFTQMEKHAGKS